MEGRARKRAQFNSRWCPGMGGTTNYQDNILKYKIWTRDFQNATAAFRADLKGPLLDCALSLYSTLHFHYNKSVSVWNSHLSLGFLSWCSLRVLKVTFSVRFTVSLTDPTVGVPEINFDLTFLRPWRFVLNCLVPGGRGRGGAALQHRAGGVLLWHSGTWAVGCGLSCWSDSYFVSSFSSTLTCHFFSVIIRRKGNIFMTK